jgi:hypothetical protein
MKMKRRFDNQGVSGGVRGGCGTATSFLLPLYYCAEEEHGEDRATLGVFI